MMPINVPAKNKLSHKFSSNTTSGNKTLGMRGAFFTTTHNSSMYKGNKNSQALVS